MLDQHQNAEDEDLFHGKLKAADEARAHKSAQDPGDENEILKLIATDRADRNLKQLHAGLHAAEQTVPGLNFCGFVRHGMTSFQDILRSRHRNCNAP
jgi:hypothetical protein